jgi:hypothetical protein
MPSQVNVNGMVTRRPGVYSIVDASALSGAELDINNVAVVGEFPFLEQATPTTASSFRALADVEFSNDDLMVLSSVLFNSASDDRVTGGPNSVTLVNAKPVTQAQNTFNDSNGSPSIKVKSKAWGSTGNKVGCSIANGTVDGQKFTFYRDGRTEVFDNVGLADVVSFQYTEVGVGAATSVTAAFTNSAGLVITNIITGVSGNLAPTKLAFSGTIKLTLSAPLGGGEAMAIAVTGTDKLTGAAVVEPVAFEVAGDTKTTTTEFSAVTSINVTNQVGFGGTWSIEAVGFDLEAATYTYASQMVDAVNAHSGYTATNEEPEATAIKSIHLDDTATADMAAAKMTVDADVQAIVNACVNSTLVDVTRATGSSLKPGNTVSDVALSGGTETTPILADWTSAFESLESKSVQIVVALPNSLLDVSGVSGVHGALRDHCKKMAGEGQSERNGWCGSAQDDTEAALFVRTKALNSRFVSMVFQDIDIIDPEGNQRNLTPSWFAAMCAGMQSGTAIGTPLTRKRPNVVSVDQNANIDPFQGANELLRKALVFTVGGRLGQRIERSLTTYLTDDNPIFSELSAVESVNTSVRDLRTNLETMIGDPADVTTAGRIKALTLSRLDTQVKEKFIKAFVSKSVTVTDLGDTFKVSYQMAPIEPVNFIVVTTLVQRQASNA